MSRPPFSILESLNKLDDLIDSNAALAEAIFVTGFGAFIAGSLDSDWVSRVVPAHETYDEFQLYSSLMDHLNVTTTQNDLEKARSCVNQFYREWSAEGAVERDQCFAPIISQLESEFAQRNSSDSLQQRADIKVLVPGAGPSGFRYRPRRFGGRRKRDIIPRAHGIFPRT